MSRLQRIRCKTGIKLRSVAVLVFNWSDGFSYNDFGNKTKQAPTCWRPDWVKFNSNFRFRFTLRLCTVQRWTKSSQFPKLLVQYLWSIMFLGRNQYAKYGGAPNPFYPFLNLTSLKTWKFKNWSRGNHARESSVIGKFECVVFGGWVGSPESGGVPQKIIPPPPQKKHYTLRFPITLHFILGKRKFKKTYTNCTNKSWGPDSVPGRRSCNGGPATKLGEGENIDSAITIRHQDVTAALRTEEK